MTHSIYLYLYLSLSLFIHMGSFKRELQMNVSLYIFDIFYLDGFFLSISIVYMCFVCISIFAFVHTYIYYFYYFFFSFVLFYLFKLLPKMENQFSEEHALG